MPKQSRRQTRQKPKRRRGVAKVAASARDANQTAYAVLQEVIKQTEGTGKNPLAVALGRRGGLKGGRARAEKLSSEERRASAIRAARARWDRQKHD